VRWVAAEGSIERDTQGRPVGVRGITRDITGRKKAEEERQQSERKLRELLGALPAAVYVTDAEGHITYCNQSAVDLWGIEPIPGKDRWSDLSLFYHADGSPMAPEDCPTQRLGADAEIGGRLRRLASESAEIEALHPLSVRLSQGSDPSSLGR
jgi:PAS domain-containing protein